MAQRGQVTSTNRDELILGVVAAGMAALLLGSTWAAVHATAWATGEERPPANPVELVVGIATGDVSWTATTTAFLAGLLCCLLILGLITLVVLAKRSSRRQRPDRAGKHMAQARDIRAWSRKGAAAKSQRLAPGVDTPGVPFGKSIRTGQMLWSSWEDMLVLIAGPRTQKSTAYAIPNVLAAPGAALATSNKRDVLDATRGPRSEVGRTWIFDPQGVANEEATWWWNPLTYIAPPDRKTNSPQIDPATGWVVADEARAEKLAGQFVASSRQPGARVDAYFDSEAESLIGLLLLAAAVGDEPITKVYRWLTLPTDETPVDYLRDNGFELQEQALYALSHLPDKQREGVYGTARSLMGFLRQRRLVQWIVPGDRDRPMFDPVAFAASTDTLYPLSKEGEGSAGPLVAALTVAVIDALEARATASPDGRLPVPFVGVLDEAANICRFRNLDSYYSHFGSRGIVLLTILQNWAQGEEVWSREGMEKLWSAANVKIYGGGVDDDRFLRRMSDLIGPYDRVETSETRGTHTSRSRSVQERTILTVAELREMPRGRAVVFASGTPAMLIEPTGWWDRPEISTSVRESLATFAPRSS